MDLIDAVDDTISRQAAIDALGDEPEVWTGKDEYAMGLNNQWHYDRNAIKAVPSAQQTLYGYKIGLLAYIARVMEKEGITAEQAVRTFDDMSRAIGMIIEEAQQKAEEMLSEEFSQLIAAVEAERRNRT